MIEFEEMRQLFCRTYGGLRERVVETADDWIGDGGEFLQFPWMRELCGLVVSRLEQGDYKQAAALFQLVETLLEVGDERVQTVVATGLLEGLQHQTRITANLWRPLLGPLAQSHCDTVDKFHGITE